MAEDSRLQHFHFDDPISKEAISRTTRYRLLKKRRRDKEVEEIEVPETEIDVAEDEIAAEHGAGDNFDLSTGNNEQFSPVHASSASSTEDVENDIEEDDEDVDLPVDPETEMFTDFSDSDENSDEDPEAESVFQGCPLSKSASNLLVLKYRIRHNLTLQATSDLLDLLRIHCPAPNTIPSSLHHFNGQFPTLNYQTTLHYFCSSCLQLVPGTQASTCPNTSCGKSLKTFRSLSSFIELSLEEQVMNLMERK